MARIRRNQKETDERIIDLVEAIIADKSLSEESVDAIENRADIVKKMIRNGSKENWSVDDPGLVSELIGHMVAEYIFSTMNNDEHRNFAEELVNAIVDSEKKPREANSDRERKPRVKTEASEYFDSLLRFLKTNGFDARPSFSLFQKYVSKFNAKKIIAEPEFKSDRDCYTQWETWIVKK